MCVVQQASSFSNCLYFWINCLTYLITVMMAHTYLTLCLKCWFYEPYVTSCSVSGFLTSLFSQMENPRHREVSNLPKVPQLLNGGSGRKPKQSGSRAHTHPILQASKGKLKRLLYEARSKCILVLFSGRKNKLLFQEKGGPDGMFKRQ